MIKMGAFIRNWIGGQGRVLGVGKDWRRRIGDVSLRRQWCGEGKACSSASQNHSRSPASYHKSVYVALRLKSAEDRKAIGVPRPPRPGFVGNAEVLSRAKAEAGLRVERIIPAVDSAVSRAGHSQNRAVERASLAEDWNRAEEDAHLQPGRS